MRNRLERRSVRQLYGDDRPSVVSGPMLRLKDVVERTALSESCVRRLVAAGVFPPFVCLGVRARGLPELVLDAWLAQCLSLRSSMRTLQDAVLLPSWRGLPPVCIPCSGIRMLRRRDVETLVGLRKSAVFRRIGLGEFPAPAPLGDRVRRWARHEIACWVRERECALHLVRSVDAPWLASPELVRKL